MRQQVATLTGFHVNEIAQIVGEIRLALLRHGNAAIRRRQLLYAAEVDGVERRQQA